MRATMAQSSRFRGAQANIVLYQAERTWLARILDIERTVRRNRARKAGIPRARL